MPRMTIPSSVTSIGAYAFYNCSSLGSVEIPSGVTSIGECAFQYCKNLSRIVIPDSVTSIDKKAFGDCSSLRSIIVTKGSYAEKWVNDWVYRDLLVIKSSII